MTNTLRAAAQALIDRWDGPQWGGSADTLHHTSKCIADLRAALAEQSADQEPLKDVDIIDMANTALPGWLRRDNDLAYIKVARAVERAHHITGENQMTPTQRKAMELALEALLAATPVKAKDPQVQAAAIVDLRAALAEQPAQEPVAYWHQCRKKPELVELSMEKSRPDLSAKGYEARPLIFGDTAPQPAKRVPLTEQEARKLWSDAHNDTTDRMPYQVFVKLIEAHHGIEGGA